jgi:hypothetical protein
LPRPAIGADVTQAWDDNVAPVAMAAIWGANNGDFKLLRSLIKELVADIHQANYEGCEPLCVAVADRGTSMSLLPFPLYSFKI